MGAWGVSVFADDSSLDWIEEDYQNTGLSAVRRAVGVAADGYLEHDSGAAARAAGEVVAVCFGSEPADVDPEDLALLKVHCAEVVADSTLPALALTALERVAGPNSELNELWTESESTATEWKSAITELRDRLEAVVQ